MTEIEIPGYQTLEALLTARLNEMLDSIHRSDLKGKFRVKIAPLDPPEERRGQIAKARRLNK